jgi:hypothetical protein
MSINSGIPFGFAVSAFGEKRNVLYIEKDQYQTYTFDKGGQEVSPMFFSFPVLAYEIGGEGHREVFEDP